MKVDYPNFVKQAAKLYNYLPNTSRALEQKTLLLEYYNEAIQQANDRLWAERMILMNTWWIEAGVYMKGDNNG